jgi:hypothetical protein
VLMLLLYSRMQQASKVRQYPSHGMAKRRPPSTPPAGWLRLLPSLLHPWVSRAAGGKELLCWFSLMQYVISPSWFVPSNACINPVIHSQHMQSHPFLILLFFVLLTDGYHPSVSWANLPPVTNIVASSTSQLLLWSRRSASVVILFRVTKVLQFF